MKIAENYEFIFILNDLMSHTSMHPHYLTLIDAEGNLAKIIPFDPRTRSYQSLEGSKLGSSAVSEEDRLRLLQAYGEAIVDGERVHCTYHWQADKRQTHLELDILRFPPVNVSALLLSAVVQNQEQATLTKREISIIKMSAEDSTDADISRILRISKTTVSRHKQNIRAKLKMKEWAGVVAWAVRIGLIG